MSKVFETEYDYIDNENIGETIFYLKLNSNNDYKKLGYFINYFNMLKDYPIGHIFSFHCDTTEISISIGLDPTYTDKNLDEPNCYFIEIDYSYNNRIFDRSGYMFIDIYNNKIINKSCNYDFLHIHSIFNNIFI